MLAMIIKEIFITNDHQQNNLCQQSIIFEKPSLPSFPAFDDHWEIRKTLLKIRVCVFPIKAIYLVGLWDLLSYIEGVERQDV